MSADKHVPLNDRSTFGLVSGLWKSERQPLRKAFVLRSTNFRGDGLLDYSDALELDVEERHLTERKLLRGDIIVERSGGGPKQPVGRVALFDPVDDRIYATSNFTTVLRISDPSRFDSRYVALYLHALYLDGATETLQRATTGIRNLDWHEYLRFQILEVPLADQLVIATFYTALRQLYLVEDELLANSSKIKRAAMHELFMRGLRGGSQKETEFGPVPGTWNICALNDVATVQTGVAKGRRVAAAEMLTVPYLRVANVQDGYLDLREMKSIEIRRSELQRFLLQDGDVVLTEGGDFDKLGRGFIWRGQVQNCVHQNHVFAVRVDRTKLVPEFMAYLAQCPYGRAYFLKVAHKTTNLASINSTKLKAFPVLVPEVPEQREIVAILDAIDRKINLHQKKCIILEDLFKSLLHKLMAGEIRAADLDLSVLRQEKDQEAA